MKEILIHKNSKLFYSEKPETFVYVSKENEISMD